MKTKLISILIVFMLVLVSCDETKINEIPEQDDKYKIVTPTQEEINEINDRMLPILGMYWSDYDCTIDSIYDDMFNFNHLQYIFPEYNEEVTKYIAEPLVYSLGKFPLWDTLVNENDPLGKFPKIPEEGYDENGNVDEYLISSLDGYNYTDLVIGYNKFSGAYIDWLVEGVWNGKVDHETFFEFPDRTKCYYHDGFYYTPQTACDDRGGGIMCGSIIESVTPITNGKYELKYTVVNEIDAPEYFATAVIAMKESQNGFRFWSIYSIDIENVDSLSINTGVR